MNLAAQILVKNDEITIEQCLNSISNFCDEILIGDLGSFDKTLDICKKYKTKIINLSLNKNFSLCRNNLNKFSNAYWNFYLEPWEEIIAGEGFFRNLDKNFNLHKINCIKSDIITKETRIWHKNVKFENPVYECIKGESKLNQIFCKSGEDNRKKLKSDILHDWKNSEPLSNNVNYYFACWYLQEKKWDQFLNYANIFLHKEVKQIMPAIMLYFYCSMVYCYIKKDYKEATRHIMPCLAEKPMMAEYWCILADIFYGMSDYKKAISFYENAIICGQRRLNDDDYPLEISKYEEYPNKMIQSCKNIFLNTKIYKF